MNSMARWQSLSMRKRLLSAAALLLIVCNALILLKVAYNRSSVVQSIVLTERELSQSYRYYSADVENSGIDLQLRWHTGMRPKDDYYYAGNHQIMVSNELHEALGFGKKDCTNGVYQGRYYTRNKTAWLLMELEGKAYKNDLVQLDKMLVEAIARNNDQDKINNLQNQFKDLRDTESRLYAIALAADREELVAQITDTKSRFVVKVLVNDAHTCTNDIYVQKVFMDNLHVAKEKIDAVNGLPEKYFVKLAVGKLDEAWIESITVRP